MFLSSIILQHKTMATSTQLKADALMEQAKLYLSTDAGKESLKKIGLIFQLNIAPKRIGVDEKCFILDFKNGEIKEGAPEDVKPDATFSFADNDFIKIQTGKMNPQVAFMRGLVKVKGSMVAAQKFPRDLFLKQSKL